MERIDPFPRRAAFLAALWLCQVGPAWAAPKSARHEFRVAAHVTAEGGGWRVADFGLAFVNPGPEEVRVQVRLVSDDPGFVFSPTCADYARAGGCRGEYRFAPFTLGAYREDGGGMLRNTNIIGVALPALDPDVPPLNPYRFTGTAIVEAERPIYVADPASISFSASDATAYQAYQRGWSGWTARIAGEWDSETGSFVIPYAGAWWEDHWPRGWRSRLVLHNRDNVERSFTVRRHDSGALGTTEEPCVDHPAPPVVVRSYRVGPRRMLSVDLFEPSAVRRRVESAVFVTPELNDPEGAAAAVIVEPDDREGGPGCESPEGSVVFEGRRCDPEASCLSPDRRLICLNAGGRGWIWARAFSQPACSWAAEEHACETAAFAARCASDDPLFSHSARCYPGSVPGWRFDFEKADPDACTRSRRRP